MRHGHVIPNPDGSKARCGGPALCKTCALELAQTQQKAAPMSKPSEKAMQLADRIGRVYPRIEREGLADAFDAHTAEALSEHKRVLDECERPLQLYADPTEERRDVFGVGMPDFYEESCFADPARKLLAAIAELKTNEKLG